MSTGNTGCCCPSIINIDSTTPLPFTIPQSNTTYCFISNVTWSADAGEPAIIFPAGTHDVVIDLNGFQLITANGVETGILLQGFDHDFNFANTTVYNVTIKNGSILSPFISFGAPFNTFVSLTDPANTTDASYHDIVIENVYFANVTSVLGAISLAASPTDLGKNVTIKDCRFTGAFLTNFIQSVAGELDNINILNCRFFDANLFFINATAIALNAILNNITVKGCDVSNVSGGFSFTNNLPVPATNLLIENCKISAVISAVLDIASIQQATIRNCFFEVDTPGFEVVRYTQWPLDPALPAIGLTVEGCHFKQNSGGEFLTELSSTRVLVLGGEQGISTGSPVRAVQNVIIRDNTFTLVQPDGENTYGILAFGGSSFLIEGNTFYCPAVGRDANCNLFQPLINSTGSTIPDRDACIHLGSAAGEVNVTDVIIRNNQIGGPCQVGIYSTTGPLATPNQRIVIENNNITAVEQGILFENTSSSKIQNNHISGVNGNTCTNNVGFGIQLSGKLPYNLTASSSCNVIENNTVVDNTIGILVKCRTEGNYIAHNKAIGNKDKQIVVGNKHKNTVGKNVEIACVNCEAR